MRGKPIILLLLTLAAPALAGTPGDFNAARFGTACVLASDAAQPAYAPVIADGKPDTALGVPAGGSARIEWRLPREVHQLRLTFDGAAPKPEDVEISWWYRIWPDNGEGGWLKLDDPFNGRFVRAAVQADASHPGELRFRFAPLDTTEAPQARKTGFDWRTTYKIRATLKTGARLAEIECITDSKWKSASVVVDLPAGGRDARFEARNAEITSIEPRANGAREVYLRYADNPDRQSPDRGLVIVRRGGKGADFSFFIDDVVHEGSIYVRDIDALVYHGERAELFTR